MDLPIYIPSIDTIVRSKRQGVVVNGETYGLTDYDDPTKLAEMEARPLREIGPADGYVADGWEVVNDPENPSGSLRRPFSASLLPQPSLDTLKAKKEEAVKARTNELLLQGVTITWPYDGQSYSFDTVNQPGAERAEKAIEKMGIAARAVKDGVPGTSALFANGGLKITSKNYEPGPTIADADQLLLLQVMILQAETVVTDAGSALITSIRAAADQEELDAIVDNR